MDHIRQNHIAATAPGPHVLLTAGVHGDEYEPMIAASELMKALSGKLLRGKVTVVPVVNESAYSAGNRCGEDHLDLARICPGKPDGSISERYAFQVSALIRQADYLIDMHTGGLAHHIFPLAGYMLHPAAGILDKQREMALAYNLPVIWGTDHRPNGRTLSVARDANIPAIYLEYGGGSGIRKEVIKAYKDGFLNLLRSWKMIAGAVKTIPAEERFWVEDARPDSGYFQGKMPSPAEGIFIASTSPGNTIQRGEVFGMVIDAYTGRETTIYADMNGLVLSVRVSVRVQAGDALGAIIPVSAPGKITIDH